MAKFIPCDVCGCEEQPKFSVIARRPTGEVYLIECPHCGSFVPCKADLFERDKLVEKLQKQWLNYNQHIRLLAAHRRSNHVKHT